LLSQKTTAGRGLKLPACFPRLVELVTTLLSEAEDLVSIDRVKFPDFILLTR